LLSDFLGSQNTAAHHSQDQDESHLFAVRCLCVLLCLCLSLAALVADGAPSKMGGPKKRALSNPRCISRCIM
jgi:hypothetical protein